MSLYPDESAEATEELQIQDEVDRYEGSIYPRSFDWKQSNKKSIDPYEADERSDRITEESTRSWPVIFDHLPYLFRYEFWIFEE